MDFRLPCFRSWGPLENEQIHSRSAEMREEVPAISGVGHEACALRPARVEGNDLETKLEKNAQ